MWYYNFGNERLGPVPDPELQGLLARGQLTPQTLVWREGMEDWLPLADVELTPPSGLPASDERETCAYSGETMKCSEMVTLGGFWIAQAHREAAIAFVREGGQLPRETCPMAEGNVSPGHLLRRTWQLLKTSGLLAFGFTLVVFVAAGIFQGFVTSYIVSQSHGAVRSVFGSGFFFTGVVLVAVGISAGGVLHVFDERSKGRPVSFDQAAVAGFAQCLRMGFAVLVLALLAFVPVAAPVLWLIVHDYNDESPDLDTLMLIGMLALSPTCYPLLARSSLICVELLDRKVGLIGAFRRSWAITRGYFWRTLSFVVVLTVGYMLQKYAVKTLSHSASIPIRLLMPGLGLLFYIAGAAFIFSYGKELKALHERKQRNLEQAR